MCQHWKSPKMLKFRMVEALFRLRLTKNQIIQNKQQKSITYMYTHNHIVDLCVHNDYQLFENDNHHKWQLIHTTKIISSEVNRKYPLHGYCLAPPERLFSFFLPLSTVHLFQSLVNEIVWIPNSRFRLQGPWRYNKTETPHNTESQPSNSQICWCLNNDWLRGT